MTSVSTTETIQEEADIVRTMIDKLESRLGPSSRPRLGAFESSPEALSGAINFGIIVTSFEFCTIFISRLLEEENLVSRVPIFCNQTVNRSNERSLTFVVFLFLAFPGFLPQLLYTAQKCIENYVTKGYIIDLSLMEYWAQDWYLAIALQIAMFCWCLVTVYPLTTLAIRRRLPYPAALALYIASQAALWILPLIFVFAREFSPLLGTSTSMHIAVDSMKIHSYWATNWILAKKGTKKKKEENPTSKFVYAPPMELKKFVYFLMAPTLVYETEYPRTLSIRWKHFFSLALQSLASCFVMYVIITEDLIPVYHQSLYMPLWRAVFRLALPSFAMWLLIFYLLFHCILGMIAEVTTFADREFYLDWWNARTFGDWWRKWNRPVHRWLSRHIYFDSMHTMNYDKDLAALATFALSALVHEVVLAVAFRMVRPILFTTVILQLALIYLTKLSIFQSSGIGNAIMWLSLMLGQPGVQILYAREWMLSRMLDPTNAPSFSLS